MASSISSMIEGTNSSQRSYASISSVLEVPNLIQVQLDSFNWLKGEGLAELFRELSPIEDFPGGRFELSFLDHRFETIRLQKNQH